MTLGAHGCMTSKYTSLIYTDVSRQKDDTKFYMRRNPKTQVTIIEEHYRGAQAGVLSVFRPTPNHPEPIADHRENLQSAACHAHVTHSRRHLPTSAGVQPRPAQKGPNNGRPRTSVHKARCPTPARMAPTPARLHQKMLLLLQLRMVTKPQTVAPMVEKPQKVAPKAQTPQTVVRKALKLQTVVQSQSTHTPPVLPSSP